ncbi:hypothetical protein SERLA73DRAFT_100109 [Serpula lacrymans var. lacrymans S7.3]|uniref:TEA domain-containing protein n=1 Tax=Serpula lacrymans var. lacrymans (strain S7.3) TaxID=936435 RepID=F8QIR3_SERL3|nr:hypothetical protein SERLA73DRAFT_100109 [Serpula lacrymans var. lacrymans S7.3]
MAPYLEAAMLAGLQEYEPDDSRETRILGRFPMRNRFISDYIYRTTGKYRTAKQVGSRLQQLRDTSEGRELMDSLTSCYHRPRNEAGHSSFIFTPHPWATTSSVSLPRPPSDLWASDSSSSTCSSPISPSTDYTPVMPSQPEKSHMPRTVIPIDVLPEFIPWSASSFQSSANDTYPSFSMTGGDGNLLLSGSPRPMRNIDPTVTFVSPSPITAKSSYIVLFDGAPVHSEDTRMQVVDLANTAGRPDGSLLYSTTLVPNYWDTLCQASGRIKYRTDVLIIC